MVSKMLFSGQVVVEKVNFKLPLEKDVKKEYLM